MSPRADILAILPASGSSPSRRPSLTHFAPVPRHPVEGEAGRDGRRGGRPGARMRLPLATANRGEQTMSTARTIQRAASTYLVHFFGGGLGRDPPARCRQAERGAAKAAHDPVVPRRPSASTGPQRDHSRHQCQPRRGHAAVRVRRSRHRAARQVALLTGVPAGGVVAGAAGRFPGSRLHLRLRGCHARQ